MQLTQEQNVGISDLITSLEAYSILDWEYTTGGNGHQPHALRAGVLLTLEALGLSIEEFKRFKMLQPTTDQLRQVIIDNDEDPEDYDLT